MMTQTQMVKPEVGRHLTPTPSGVAPAEMVTDSAAVVVCAVCKRAIVEQGKPAEARKFFESVVDLFVKRETLTFTLTPADGEKLKLLTEASRKVQVPVDITEPVVRARQYLETVAEMFAGNHIKAYTMTAMVAEKVKVLLDITHP